jgi:hypothetical protein
MFAATLPSFGFIFAGDTFVSLTASEGTHPPQKGTDYCVSVQFGDCHSSRLTCR